MMPSPNEEQQCPKCDIMLCHEIGVISPISDLQPVSSRRIESVRRCLTFSEGFRSFRDADANYDSDTPSITTTISNDSNSPSRLLKKRELSSSSSSSAASVFSENGLQSTQETLENSQKSSRHSSVTPTQSQEISHPTENEVDLKCTEEMPKSPKIAYLHNKRLRSTNSFRHDSTKKKRVKC
uniref:CSON010800 protein n=1 Tax=Culicoides sonorensis TaxID=179676 RepID=A0A336N3S4_CULSO